MKWHTWNYDLSTKPDTDILTNRHMRVWFLILFANSNRIGRALLLGCSMWM
jgi:hypothetical protein